jgi:hypothetical protein
MAAVMTSGEKATGATGLREDVMPSRLTTTLYDLMTTIQEVAGPDDEALVIATIMHLLRSGRLTWLRPNGGRWCNVHGAVVPTG